MKLNVFRDNEIIGSLDILASEPFFGFTYAQQYLNSPKARPLSLSLPLVETRFSGINAQPFFEGLLPEGEARDIIAKRLGISSRSSVKLLRALGRDCAGDISIIEANEGETTAAGSIGEADEGKYIHLSDGIYKLAKEPYEEVTRLQEASRLSLAGAQAKIALYHDDELPIEEGWYIPSLGLPSTHIIKPGILEAYYPHITLNEFLCLHAAMLCGINTAEAEILFPSNPILIIKRYDRLVNKKLGDGLSAVKRIHQEDGCQACGVKADMKYEHDGGPGFYQIRGLLAKYAMRPIEDISMLVRWGIFNYLIGNCDAHSKNISILHNSNGTVSLAPTYDIISTAIYDGRFGTKLSREMAMRIGKHENLDKIDSNDFSEFAKSVGMRKRQVLTIAEEIIEKMPNAFETASVAAEAKGFSEATSITSRIIRGCDKRSVNLC